MNQSPFLPSSKPKSNTSAIRQVGIAMLALGTLALSIGFLVASLTN